MIFVSGYRMILSLFKLDQLCYSILCNTMVLSSTIIIVPKMIEYDKAMPQSQTEGIPGMAPWGRDTK